MNESTKIELTEDQLTVVMSALNTVAQQCFEFAIECDNEEQSERNFKKQIEYDEVLGLIIKQQNE